MTSTKFARREAGANTRRIKEINGFTVGWAAYFAFADAVLPFEKLEKWLRRRLRQVRWKEVEAPTNALPEPTRARYPRPRRPLMAASQKGYWRVAGSWPLQTALRNACWHKTVGVKGFTDPYRRFWGR